MSNIVERTTEYLSSGGLFNPELMPASKVRDLVIGCRIEIESLRAQLAELESRQSTHHCANCEDMGRRLDEAEKLLLEARGHVGYMASGMTHARWVTESAQKSLCRIDAFLAGRQP